MMIKKLVIILGIVSFALPELTRADTRTLKVDSAVSEQAVLPDQSTLTNETAVECQPSFVYMNKANFAFFRDQEFCARLSDQVGAFEKEVYVYRNSLAVCVAEGQ